MGFDFVSFFPRAVMQGIPLLFGSTGEILTEKSGNLNLGIPGILDLVRRLFAFGLKILFMPQCVFHIQQFFCRHGYPASSSRFQF